MTANKNAPEDYVLANGRILVTARRQITLDPLSDGSTVTLRIEFDPDLTKVVCTNVLITRPSPGSELTTRFLRELTITNHTTDEAMRHMIRVISDEGATKPAIDALKDFQPARGRKRPEVVADAWRLYTIASLAGWPPLKTVADHLSTSQSTATRLIAEAREQGLDTLEQLEPEALTAEELREIFPDEP